MYGERPNDMTRVAGLGPQIDRRADLGLSAPLQVRSGNFSSSVNVVPRNDKEAKVKRSAQILSAPRNSRGDEAKQVQRRN